LAVGWVWLVSFRGGFTGQARIILLALAITSVAALAVTEAALGYNDSASQKPSGALYLSGLEPAQTAPDTGNTAGVTDGISEGSQTANAPEYSPEQGQTVGSSNPLQEAINGTMAGVQEGSNPPEEQQANATQQPSGQEIPEGNGSQQEYNETAPVLPEANSTSPEQPGNGTGMLENATNATSPDGARKSIQVSLGLPERLDRLSNASLSADITNDGDSGVFVSSVEWVLPEGIALVSQNHSCAWLEPGSGCSGSASVYISPPSSLGKNNITVRVGYG
jgi:hypothetical protein